MQYAEFIRSGVSPVRWRMLPDLEITLTEDGVLTPSRAVTEDEARAIKSFAGFRAYRNRSDAHI